MKFMKLGSKPDSFQSEGSNVRFVSSELATDVVVIVDEVKFYLHKFPLLSKSYRLQRLVLENSSEGIDEFNLQDFPGGPRAFEICAKFCYGITVTLSAYNVVAARCAAEYLQMNEVVEKGNFIYKIEIFLNSSVLRSWKDSIIVLQSVGLLLPWMEELMIIDRCIDSIASKASIDPSNVNWSYNYNKKITTSDHMPGFHQRQSVPMDWWVEDICELDVHLFKQVLVAIKSKGRVCSDVILKALKTYAMRWLPHSYDALLDDEYMRRNKRLVEAIIWLLPSENGSVCSCRFLLKLLKVVILVEADDLLKEELMNRISTQLDKASATDLLLPSSSSDGTAYDVDLVQSLVKRYIKQKRSSHDGDDVGSENRTGGLILWHASLLSVGKLVDGYLAEIGSDPNLPLSSFIDFAQLLPDAARPTHDGMYAAVDIFLKAHPDLTKLEKRRICSLIDVKKLTPEASMAVAQNVRLPLRVVVQVLFFEHLRMAANTGMLKKAMNKILNENSRLSMETEKEWGQCKPLEQLRSLKGENEQPREAKNVNKNCNKGRGSVLLPSRSKRMLEKFWVEKLQLGVNRKPKSSGSSQSLKSANPAVATMTLESSPRHRRHSVS